MTQPSTLFSSAYRARSLGLIGLALLAACSGPEPLKQDIDQRVAWQKQQFSAAQVAAPGAPLEAETAAAFAFHHNLDLRLAALDRVLGSGEVDLAALDALPSLTVSAGYANRSAVESDSGNALNRRTNGTELSWNVLGLGTTWLRTQEARDHTLVYQQKQRDTANQVLIDTRIAWQQAADYEARRADMLRAEENLKVASGLLDRLERVSLSDPLMFANHRDLLLRSQIQLRTVVQQGETARGDLARLLGTGEAKKLSVAASTQAQREGALLEMRNVLAMDNEAMQDYALRHRGDLLQTDVQARQLRHDAQITWLNALPMVKVYRANRKDTDLNIDPPNWSETGYSMAFNLFGLVSAAMQHKQIKVQQSQLSLRQLVLGFSIIEQVRLGKVKLVTALENWASAQARSQSSARIADVRRMRTPFYEDDELQRAKAEVDAVSAMMEEDRAWQTVLQSYLGLLQVTGIDLMPSSFVDEEKQPSLDEAAERLRTHWSRLPDQLAAIEKVAGK